MSTIFLFAWVILKIPNNGLRVDVRTRPLRLVHTDSSEWERENSVPELTDLGWEFYIHKEYAFVYVFQGKEDAERDKGIRPKLRRRSRKNSFFFFFGNTVRSEAKWTQFTSLFIFDEFSMKFRDNVLLFCQERENSFSAKFEE